MFLVSVISFDKYQLTELAPFVIFPVYLVSAGGIPAAYILKKIITLSPFAFMVAVFNPIYDTAIITNLGPLPVSGGWVSFFSILLRFALTVGAVLALIATTGFYGLCNALGRLGAPRAFVAQLLFLYRYIFVLVEEGARMVRARDMRSSGAKGQGIAVYGPLAGTLLLRSIDRARKIHRAMVSRGFDGDVRLSRSYSFGVREYLFIVLWTALFIILRICNVSLITGEFIMKALS